jgi:S1-C subfamily serine protease
VRDEIHATGPDIYHRSEVTRDVYSLYADVEPGNSGGPLLSTDGDVYGVIFAKSLDDSTTGYALTAAEARPVVRQGRDATARTDTDTCA